MPALDGFGCLDALSELREHRTDLEHVDVTVLSSSNHPEDLRRSMSFPAVVSHLVKMPSAEQLDELIRDSGATAAEPTAQVTDCPRPCPD